jgi:hypothetical protein
METIPGLVFCGTEGAEGRAKPFPLDTARVFAYLDSCQEF